MVLNTVMSADVGMLTVVYPLAVTILAIAVASASPVTPAATNAAETAAVSVVVTVNVTEADRRLRAEVTVTPSQLSVPPSHPSTSHIRHL